MPEVYYLVVISFAFGAILISWFYFRHYQISRTPIGVFNLKDIISMMAFIVIAPYLYLILPLFMAIGLLLLATLSILYYLFEPVLRKRGLIWLVILSLAALDFLASSFSGPKSNWYYLVNNLVLLLSIIGLTNLWAQSGMKAREAAVLGGLLAIYDVVATSLFTLTSDMFDHLAGLPFAPQVAWNSGDSNLSIGLGDLLLAAVFPLVMRKAFGKKAGLISLAINMAIFGLLLALPFRILFPVMVILGPIMVLQYIYWQRQKKQERTTYQYLQEEPLRKI